MSSYDPAGHHPPSTMGNTPSLSSILQTLASYAPPKSATDSQPHQSPPKTSDENTPTLDPRKATAPKPHTYNPPQPFSRPQSTSKASPDPSTLTTYPPSLRHISTLITTQPAIHQRITHLIREQHSHEKQWHRGREDLMRRIRGRKDRQKEADDVLRRLKAGREILGLPVDDIEKEEGGVMDVDKSDVGEDGENEEEVLKRELEAYDKKVWSAQREMCKAVEGELKGMGIPGFCIREGLVRREGSKGLRAIEGEGDGGGSGQKSLSTMELVELKRKVLGLLGDLCGEEGT